MTPEKPIKKELEPKRHLWIEAMGMPACGKSTLCLHLGNQLEMDYIGEVSVSKIPFFDEYNKDPKKWAFPAQTSFLFHRRRQIVGIDDETGIINCLKNWPVISEPTIYQNGLYARARLEGNRKEMEAYQKFYEGMINDDVKNPDLILYLRLEFPDFLKRLEERAKKNPERKSELEVDEKYWKRLFDLIEEWVVKNPHNLNIMTIDINHYDFNKYSDEKTSVEAFLSEHKQLICGSLANQGNIIIPRALID